MNKLLLIHFPSKLLTRQFHVGNALKEMHQEGKFRQLLLKKKLGNREQVCFGINGEPNYFDDTMFPFPTIRFKENSGEIMVLRLKEMGDWRKLKTEEKKSLYRASFCQTFAEFKARKTEWMVVVGLGCMLVSIGIWYYIFIKLFVYPDMPDTYTDLDRRAHQLRRMIDAQVNPITGLSSKWDYDKEEWKSYPGKWYRSIDVWNLWYPPPTLDEIKLPPFDDCTSYETAIVIQGEDDEEEEDDCRCLKSHDEIGICGIEDEEEHGKPVPETPTTFCAGDQPATKPKYDSQYTCIGDEKTKKDEDDIDEEPDDKKGVKKKK